MPLFLVSLAGVDDEHTDNTPAILVDAESQHGASSAAIRSFLQLTLPELSLEVTEVPEELALSFGDPLEAYDDQSEIQWLDMLFDDEDLSLTYAGERHHNATETS